MNEIDFVVKLRKTLQKDFENLRKYFLLCIDREPQKLVNKFLSATSSKLADYNAVCNSDLEQNGMCDAINSVQPPRSTRCSSLVVHPHHLLCE